MQKVKVFKQIRKKSKDFGDYSCLNRIEIKHS